MVLINGLLGAANISCIFRTRKFLQYLNVHRNEGGIYNHDERLLTVRGKVGNDEQFTCSVQCFEIHKSSFTARERGILQIRHSQYETL